MRNDFVNSHMICNVLICLLFPHHESRNACVWKPPTVTSDGIQADVSESILAYTGLFQLCLVFRKHLKLETELAKGKKKKEKQRKSF